MRRTRWRAIRLCAAVAAGLSCAARAETLLRLEPALGYDSNLSRAHDSADVRSDGDVSLAASATELLALSGADRLSLGLNLGDTQYFRFHGLSFFEAGPALTYRRKFGRGAGAPWLSLSGDWAYQNFVDSIRDGNRWSVQLIGGQRWGRLDGCLGLGYDRRAARGGARAVPGIAGNAFDLHGASVFARMGYVLGPRLQGGLRLNLRRGLVEASTRPGLGIYRVSDAITEDPVFGDDFYAYRVKGTTLGGGASLSWALGTHAALNLAGGFDHTSAGGFQYDVGTAQFSYVYRY